MGTVKANYTRTANEMMYQTTFVDWDFETIWRFSDEYDYPILQALLAPVETYTSIYTADNLRKVSNDLIGNYRLMNDIDLKNTELEPIGSKDSPFGGHLDGNGYAIKNLDIIYEQDYIGLVAYNSGNLSNIYLEQVQVNTAKDYVDALTGYNTGRITNCHVSGNSSVTGGRHTGGLIGYSDTVIPLTQLFSGASVYGTQYVGGLLGYVNNSGIIKQSYATGMVTATENSTGGFIGYMYSGTVEQCYATYRQCQRFFLYWQPYRLSQLCHYNKRLLCVG